MSRVNGEWLLLLAFVVVVSSAATSIAGEITLGARAGLIESNITEAPDEWADAKSYRTGFTGGLVLNYAFNAAFSLQPELLYTSKGVTSNLYDGLVSVDLTASFDYVELPVLAKYTFLADRKFRPCVFAGPSVAYNIGSELEIASWPAAVSIDFSSLTHVSDFGLVAGAGFGYEVGEGMLTFDARFERGFTNVIMTGDFEINGSPQTISGDDFKTYGFAFTVGYMF